MLKLEDVQTYHGYLHVLKGIDLDIQEGEIFAIVGSNGAGKSTLLGTISGMYPSREGRITFREQEITRASPKNIVRKGISLVPERRQIFDSLTVEDNLLLGAYQRYRKNKRKVHEDLAQVYVLFPKLKTMESRVAGFLSGGEQQMLAVGRGLMSNPKLMMLDEPSLGLAPLVVKDIMANLTKLRDEFQTTIILVEQNVKAALKIADRACVLERGEIPIIGTAEELKHSSSIQESYLGQRKTAPSIEK